MHWPRRFLHLRTVPNSPAPSRQMVSNSRWNLEILLDPRLGPPEVRTPSGCWRRCNQHTFIEHAPWQPKETTDVRPTWDRYCKAHKKTSIKCSCNQTRQKKHKMMFPHLIRACSINCAADTRVLGMNRWARALCPYKRRSKRVVVGRSNACD